MATALPAAAHAELESTSPSPASVLLAPPRQVELRFDEAVTIDPSSLRVLALDGRRVDDGATHHVGGRGEVVATALPGHVAAGTYVVAWHVVSDDSHPVHGAFVFSVGSAAGARRGEAIASTFLAEGGSTAVGALYGVVRFVVLACLLALVGVLAVLVLLIPAAGCLRRVRWLVWGSWAGLLVATAVSVGVQGAYGASLPLDKVVSPSVLDAVVRTRFGEAALSRLVLVVLLVPVLRAVRHGRQLRAPWLVAAGSALGIGLLLTPGLAGHASTIGNGAVGEVVDVVHVGAASVWVGGLLLLGTLALPGLPAGEERPDVAGLAARFSPWAAGAVVLLVTSGVVQSVRRVGSRYALLHTSYGRILLVKIGLLVLLLCVAALSRRRAVGSWLGRRREEAPAARAGRRRREVPGSLLGGELALVAGIVVAASLLVNAVPARQAAAQPFAESFDTLGLQVNAVVAPAQVGSDNQVHFYVLDAAGRPVAVRELEATVRLSTAGGRSRTLPLVVAGPGHYQAAGVDLPEAGSWILDVVVSTSPASTRQLRAVVPVH